MTVPGASGTSFPETASWQALSDEQLAALPVLRWPHTENAWAELAQFLAHRAALVQPATAHDGYEWIPYPEDAPLSPEEEEYLF